MARNGAFQLASGRYVAVLVGGLAAAAWGQEPVRVVSVVPLGTVDARHLETVAAALREQVDGIVRIEAARGLPHEAFYAPRRRYRAERLLEALEAEPPDGSWRIVGVTEVEISTTKGPIRDWGIGGLGSIGGPACVVSTFLVRKHSPPGPKLLRRLADLAVHEFGHTVGLDHCPSRGCVMADAQGKLIRSLDQSDGEFCAYCRLRAERDALFPRRAKEVR